MVLEQAEEQESLCWQVEESPGFEGALIDSSLPSNRQNFKDGAYFFEEFVLKLRL